MGVLHPQRIKMLPQINFCGSQLNLKEDDMPLNLNTELTTSRRTMNVLVDLGVHHRHWENLVCTV